MKITDLSNVSNGVSAPNRKAVIEVLNLQLADHVTILTKTKFYHWNVRGSHFHDIHILLDEHYGVLSDMVDDLAEQSLKLGGHAPGTLAWFKSHTRIEEDEGEHIPDTREMIETLLKDHEAIMTQLHGDIAELDEKYDDAVTSNKLQDMSDKHHKMAWMLRKIVEDSDLK